jgi:hypothetical protein
LNGCGSRPSAPERRQHGKIQKLLFNLSRLSPLNARIKLLWGQFRGVEKFKGAGEAVISIDEPFLLTLILL